MKVKNYCGNLRFVKSMAKIKDNTQGVLNEVDRLISKNLRTACLLVERTAKSTGYCPVLTGTSKRSIISNWYGARGSRSISWKADKKKGIKAGETVIDVQSAKQGIIGSNVEYFPYIEMGTSKMAARAPLRRALEVNAGEIRRIFRAK